MKRPVFIPPIIADFVYQAVTGVSGVQFLEASVCPLCAGLLIGHDLKQRRFSTVMSREGSEHQYVYVKRFYCRDCNHLCYAEAPFYEKSRFGSPIVDLCITLSEDYSFSQAALIMNRLGIVIDRGTVRKTVMTHSHQVDAADLYGIKLPQSVLSLSALVTSADNTSPLSGRDVLNACGFA
ncbi:MAG TPA: hypothetical protein VN372_06170 [Methanospirillum sp.]|nr:hypothetical protein [Methanospirillum sp.]